MFVANTNHPANNNSERLEPGHSTRSRWSYPFNRQHPNSAFTTQLANQIQDSSSFIPAPSNALISPASRGYPIELGFGQAVIAKNIPFSEATAEKVGKSFYATFQDNHHSLVRIYSANPPSYEGNGTFLSPFLLLTARHLLSQNKKYFAVTQDGQQILISGQHIHTAQDQDYALILFTQPVHEVPPFPNLDNSEGGAGAYGMMHFGDGTQLMVTVGQGGGTNFTELQPQISIDGGPGSCGSLIWNAMGKGIAMHLGIDSQSGLRSFVFIHDIIKSELSIYRISWMQSYAFCSNKLRGITDCQPNTYNLSTDPYFRLEGGRPGVEGSSGNNPFWEYRPKNVVGRGPRGITIQDYASGRKLTYKFDQNPHDYYQYKKNEKPLYQAAADAFGIASITAIPQTFTFTAYGYVFSAHFEHEETFT